MQNSGGEEARAWRGDGLYVPRTNSAMRSDQGGGRVLCSFSFLVLLRLRLPFFLLFVSSSLLLRRRPRPRRRRRRCCRRRCSSWFYAVSVAATGVVTSALARRCSLLPPTPFSFLPSCESAWSRTKRGYPLRVHVQLGPTFWSYSTQEKKLLRSVSSPRSFVNL